VAEANFPPRTTAPRCRHRRAWPAARPTARGRSGVAVQGRDRRRGRPPARRPARDRGAWPWRRSSSASARRTTPTSRRAAPPVRAVRPLPGRSRPGRRPRPHGPGPRPAARPGNGSSNWKSTAPPSRSRTACPCRERAATDPCRRAAALRQHRHAPQKNPPAARRTVAAAPTPRARSPAPRTRRWTARPERALSWRRCYQTADRGGEVGPTTWRLLRDPKTLAARSLTSLSLSRSFSRPGGCDPSPRP